MRLTSQSIREWLAAIIGPLTKRERIIYGVLILALLSLFIAPRITAGNSDEGSIFAVAATECTSTDAWQNPHNIAGQSSTDATSVRADITPDNAAVWLGEPGSIDCSSFSVIPDHNRINNALSISLVAINEELSLPDGTESVQAVAKLQDGAILNQRLPSRDALIEPNLLSDSGTTSEIDSLIQLSVSTDGGETWQPLHMFFNELKTSEVVHYEIALPDTFVAKPEQLALRAETVVASDNTSVLIDSLLWTYEVGKSNEISAKLINKGDGSTKTEALPILNEPDELLFEIDLKDPNDGFWQGIRSRATDAIGDSPGPNVTVTASLYDADGQLLETSEVPTEFIGVDASNKSTWTVTADIVPASLNPGQYSLELTVDDGDGVVQTISQDFLWGVLAFNSNKASYQPGETGRFDMTVLDETGATVCDADLQMTITAPDGSTQRYGTSQATIQLGETCSVYGNQIDPDYFAEYVFEQPGIYSISLDATTANGSYTVSESIKVIEDPEFEVARLGPTRVYPILDFPMQITVYSRDGFTGKITETVPASFVIKQDGNSQAYINKAFAGSDQLLEWDVAIEAGRSVTLGYIFDAPDISPEFYTLGPLVLDDGSSLNYTEPRSWQLAGDVVGNMLLFFDGATIPTDWTCVSCTGGDAFFQQFIRGAATYGTTGGGATHTHTASGAVATTGSAAVGVAQSGTIAANAHGHTYTPTLDSPGNLPVYRQLKVIRSDVSGEPTTLPTGVIGVFDAAVPTGWTRYSAQDANYVRGEGTAGTTGGANTHTVAVSGATTAATGDTDRKATGGTQVGVSTTTHTHTVSGTSAPANNEPSYIEVILGSLDSTAAPPDALIAMWDNSPPGGWDAASGSGDPLENRFIKPAATYGTTGGTDTHNHTNTVITSGAPSLTDSTRTGTSATDDVHTHSVTVSSYSTDNHLPPYREVIFAKRNAVPIYEQAAYRWYENDNSADVGAVLAAQDNAATAPAQSTPFRLRMLTHVTVADMTTSYENFKLQYALRSGTCDTGFSGETFSDVGTASGDIRYHDNSSPTDNSALVGNANDPTHSSDTIRNQTYEEANNFTNSQAAVSIGEDGLWDFSLVDFSAPGETSYCFRIVKSDGSQLFTYSVVPEIITAVPPPKMVLLYDGATAPTGWTCISCTGGDDAYQRYIRGAPTSATGGSTTHPHTATGAVTVATAVDGRNDGAGTALAEAAHAHTYTPSIVATNNLPAYRQLKVIKYDSGTPSTIPLGAIALFDAAVPAGWTRYSAQDASYVRGENTAGTTGGSNTHTSTISGSTGAAAGAEYVSSGTGGQEQVADAGHTHAVSGSTDVVDLQPPFIETYLGQADADTTIPGSMIAMWDKDPSGTWTCVSCLVTDPFYQSFFKPANGYGTTGGTTTHTHADANLTSGTPTSISSRSGAVASADTHTHAVAVTAFSTDNHLPAYLDLVFSKSTSTNTAPNDPTNLAQEKTDATSLAVGDWTNETSVVFNADASDPDNPDSLALCVEAQPTGTAFLNTDTGCGSAVAYSGTAVAVTVTLAGLTDGEEYHWQARVKDGLGVYSGWVSFGANAESARDVGIDATAPTGTTYDGTTVAVDVDINTGALDTLSANWVIDSSPSGLIGYDYSIGTAPAAVDVKAWTSNGTTTSITDSSLTLNTGQPYYVNVRTTDGAGSQSVISSDGQFVAPTLNFTLSSSALDLGSLNIGNNFTQTGTTTLTTSTNAYNGYVVRGYATALLTNGVSTLGMFDGGSYISPDEWLTADRGYGYTSTDTAIQGVNKFNGAPCAGGGNPPCYAPWSTTAPGDIIADHTALVSGTPIVNEGFTITHRVTTDVSQPSGDYTTTIVYNITATY